MSNSSVLMRNSLGVFLILIGLVSACSTGPSANNTAPSKTTEAKFVKSEAAAVVEEFVSLVGQNRLDEANALFVPVPAPPGTLPPGGAAEALPNQVNHADVFRKFKVVLDRFEGEDAKGETSTVTVMLKPEGDGAVPMKYSFDLKKSGGKWRIEKYVVQK